MIKSLILTEFEYAKLFSESYEDEKIIRFWDNKLTNMYTHNYLYIKNNVSKNDFHEIVSNEIEIRKKNGFDFSRIEFDFSINNSDIHNFPINPKVTKYDYYYINPQIGHKLKFNEKCTIKKAITQNILKDGMEVDILANELNMGKEFATKRIKRKSEIYQQSNSNVDLYVCYYEDIPIGNCELMLSKNIAKLEDFDIIENYQRKGFGTSVIKYLLEKAKLKNINIVYLITESDDTAKEMYKKCGFKKAGEKTELFFDLS